MIKLMTEIQSKDDGTQISAARSLGLMGKGVETVLVEGLRTEHTEEFYHAIPRALLDSVQHGNKPEPVVSVILSEIRSTCEHDPTITSIKRAKRYATTLQEIMLDFSTTQSVNVMSSLHNQVTAARPQLHKTVANIRDDRAREELDTIIDSLSGSN